MITYATGVSWLCPYRKDMLFILKGAVSLASLAC